MPISNGKYVPPTGGWVNDTDPAINATEMNAISDTLKQVPIANGGTGATTASGARTNLGFGAAGSANTPVYFNSSGLPTAMTGALPVSRGGTGATTTAGIRTNLGFGAAGSANTPVYFNSNGLPAAVTGALPIAKGGTGATSAASARTNLGFGSVGSATRPVYFNSNGLPAAMTGALPLAYGGTGYSEVLTYSDSTISVQRWGVMVQFTFQAQSATTKVEFPNGAVPSTWRPSHTVTYLVPVFASVTSGADAAPIGYAQATITMSGAIYVEHYNNVVGAARFTVGWLKTVSS